MRVTACSIDSLSPNVYIRFHRGVLAAGAPVTAEVETDVRMLHSPSFGEKEQTDLETSGGDCREVGRKGRKQIPDLRRISVSPLSEKHT